MSPRDLSVRFKTVGRFRWPRSEPWPLRGVEPEPDWWLQDAFTGESFWPDIKDLLWHEQWTERHALKQRIRDLEAVTPDVHLTPVEKLAAARSLIDQVLRGGHA